MAEVRPAVRIVLCLPVYGAMATPAVASLCQVFHESLASGLVSGYSFVDHTYIDRARNEIVRQALSLDPTHLMWIDSDMVMPPDTVSRLASHGLACVGGTYHCRTAPYSPIAYDFVPEGIEYQMVKFDGELQQVEGTGGGCLLVTAEVIRRMAEHYGDECWFKLTPEMGEDVWFFRRLKEMSVPVWLDTSVRCGQVSDQIITHENWVAAGEQIVGGN